MLEVLEVGGVERGLEWQSPWGLVVEELWEVAVAAQEVEVAAPDRPENAAGLLQPPKA